MKTLFTILLFVLLILAVSNGIRAEVESSTEASAMPSIEGTYVLVSRELPDGSVVNPPDLNGIITFTKEYRNFNIFWSGPNGEKISMSSFSRFVLSAAEVTETNIFRLVNDEISGTGFAYDFSDISGSSPVTVNEDGSISFKMPLNDEPNIIFSGDKFEAYVEGAFRDFWERVE